MGKFIVSINEFFNCVHIKLTDEIIEEVSKFKSTEELLRSGGISIEALDRAAHGFSSEDIKTLMPNQLNIKWKDDLENVKHEVQIFSKKYNDLPLSKVMKIWASGVNLEEPIDVSYEKNKFYIEDGHHRYYAAKILNKSLNVNLEIKMNPIIKLAPSLSYDDFHRCVFNQVKEINKDGILSEQLITNNVIAFHGTRSFLPFKKFENNMIGSGIVSNGKKFEGFFFTSEKENAEYYTEYFICKVLINDVKVNPSENNHPSSVLSIAYKNKENYIINDILDGDVFSNIIVVPKNNLESINIIEWVFVGDEETIFEKWDETFGNGEDDFITTDMIDDFLEIIELDLNYLLKIPIFNKYYNNKK